MRKPLQIRVLMIAVMVGFLILFAGVFVIFFYQAQSRALQDGIDRELLTAAMMAKDVLPEQYHDRITGPDSLNDAEYQQVVERFNQICKQTGMEYLWSLMLLDNQVVFASATSPSKDAAQRDQADFFEKHSNPELYLPAFESMQPQFQINEDQWGRIRAVLVPFYDSHGRKVLMGASRRMQEVDSLMRNLWVYSLLLGGGVVLLGALITVALVNIFARPINTFKDAVSKIAAGDYQEQNLFATHSMAYSEIASLANSFETMRQAIQNREESLKKKEQQYRLLTESIQDVVWILDTETLMFQYVSPSMQAMRGFSVEEVMVQPVTYALTPEAAAGLVGLIRARAEAFQNGQQPASRFYTDEVEQPCKDGSRVWAEVISSFYHNPDNGRVEARGVTRDITRRRQAEEAMRRSEEKFSTLFHANHIPMALTSYAAGQFIDVNEGFLQLSGYMREEVIGRSATDLNIWVYPEERAHIFSEIQAHGGLANYEMTGRLKSGEKVILSWSAEAVIINEEPCLLVSGINITARKQAEAKVLADQEELHRLLDEAEHSRQVLFSLLEDQREAEERIHQLNRELEQRVRERTALLTAANQELEAFSYSVSHDLRAPLRALIGFSTALLEDCAGQLDEQGQHYLFRIQEASQRMGQLISDLLNLSRVSRAELFWREVNLSALAQTIATDLTTQAPDRQVQFTIAGDLVVQGDANLLKIALENLLSNAHKFTGKCQRAAIQVGALEQDGEQVYFVRDNGAGFSMEYAQKLFTPFQRLHGAQEFSGTGIGLSIVQRIIARHGGRIWPDASVDHGATFYFTLPRSSYSIEDAPP